MIFGKKVIVVMPAYNAEKTLRSTYEDLPHEFVDDVVLVDDASTDRTARLSGELNIRTVIHRANKGYGANQKTCYTEALRLGADIVVMVHPDYQYTPKLVTAMSSMIACGIYDLVLGSRVLTGGALTGRMPVYKYVANRVLTLIQNLVMGHKLSEYHTGYRAFSRQVLESLALNENSDDFVFDNQMLAQALFAGFKLGEVSCPTKYFEDASSISFSRSVTYGTGVLKTSFQYRLQKWGLQEYRIFSSRGRRLDSGTAQGDGAGLSDNRAGN